jgi:hypothetical protein
MKDELTNNVLKATERYYVKNDPAEINKRKRSRSKKPVKKTKHPAESWEHRMLVREMNFLGLCFMHPPNEGKRSVWGGRIMFDSMGALKGAADLYIFNPLPNCPTARGLAIELKRVVGSSPAWGSESQHDHLYDLSRHGWKAFVCRGHKAAFEVLRLCGLKGGAENKASHKYIREFVHGQSSQQEFFLS